MTEPDGAQGKRRSRGGRSPTESMIVEHLGFAFETAVRRYAEGEWAAEAARARTAYGERTGRVFEDDEIFEARSASFVEWYLAERPLAGTDRAPMHHLAAAEPGPELAAAYRAWAASHRSLFAVVRLDEGLVTLDDLVAGGRFAVDERRQLHGVAAGDLVEARLLGWQGKVVFGRTFLYHPVEARTEIEARVARLRGEGWARTDVVDALAALRIKALRYRHVPAKKIYAGG